MSCTVGCDCGCCEAGGPSTPLAIANRAGLAAIAYRVGTYASFRATMLDAIAGDARLDRLTTRDDDDYAITVLDLWAAVGDVLTFYQERYANEAYLGTATQRASIGRLARLIDYSLRPGVAALADLAFTLDDGVRLALPTRLRVQSVPAAGEQAQVFETIEAITADWRLNRAALAPLPYGAVPLASGTTTAWVAPGPAGLASVTGITAGDTLVAYHAATAELLVVSSLTSERDRARLTWERAIRGDWTAATPLEKVGRTWRLFGADAPAQPLLPVMKSGTLAHEFVTTDYAVAAKRELELAARTDGIATGTRLLVVDTAHGSTTAVTVTAVRTGPATAIAGLAGTTTILATDAELPTLDRRSTTVYELGDAPVALWGYAQPERLRGASVLLTGTRDAQDRIAIGETIIAGALSAGTPIGVAEIESDRRVMVGDATTDPVPATIEAVSLCGSTAVVGATAADPRTVRALGLAAGLQARAVLGAERPDALTGAGAARRLVATIGDLPPATLTLGGGHPTPFPHPHAEGQLAVASKLAVASQLASPRATLQAALRAASPEAAFAEAVVLTAGRRLLVIAGDPTLPIAFAPAPDDPLTVSALGLDHDEVTSRGGVAGTPLTEPIALSAPAPQLAVTLGPIGPVTVPVTAAATRAELATALALALTAADPAPAFAGARVVVVAGRLVLLPGPLDAPVAEALRLDLALDAPLDLDPATAYLLGNVAAASHGETLRGEVLGDGDAATAFARFALAKQPLTYVPSAQAGGLASSLAVSVGGVEWDAVPGLYGQPSDARVYAARIADDGIATVQVGDGTTGATVPTGHGNVVATYRHGAGIAGRVRAHTLTTALDRPTGLRDVVNPLAATGGADPERAQDARANAPTTVRTFGRAVALDDFADLLRDSGQAAKTAATWVWDGYDRAVHLTVAEPGGGQLSDADLARLGAALAAAREPDYRLRLANYVSLPIRVSATLGVDAHYVRSEVLAAATAAVEDALSFDAVALGEEIHLSELYAVIQSVAGVTWATITELEPRDPAQRDRPNVDRLADGTPAPLQPHVRVFAARPDPAHPGAVLPAELATLADPSRDLVVAATGGIDG